MHRIARMTKPTINPLTINQTLAARCAHLRPEPLGILNSSK
jgi:hypothetical protein